jgi:uncharacterized membrane protein YdjX (TVP38/TMEM64 family)
VTAPSNQGGSLRQRQLIVVGVVVVSFLGWLYSNNAFAGISDPERIRQLVDSYGAWGPLVFVAIAMAAFPVFLFGPAVWASMLVWPWPLALLYSYIAAILASLLAFEIARRGSGGKKRVPEKLQHYTAGLLERPITTVIIVRLVLWANPVADLLIALSGVSLRAYLIGTLIGMLPPTVGHVFIGAGIQQLDGLPTEAWIAFGSLGLVLIVWIVLRRRSAQPTSRP